MVNCTQQIKHAGVWGIIMKLINKMMMAFGLFAISSIGFASSVTPSAISGAVGDITLVGTSDTVSFSGNFADITAPTDSVFYGLTVSDTAGVVAGARSVVFDSSFVPTFGDILLSIITDGGDGIFGSADDSLLLSATNSLSNFILNAGTQYFLELTGPSNTGYSGTISTVPVPAAGVLFASALFGAGFLGRRKKKAIKSNMVGAFARAA